MRLKVLQNMVEKVLEENADARFDDNVLTLEVWKRQYGEELALCNVGFVLTKGKKLGLSPQKSIERVRRMVKKERPELFDKPTEEARFLEQEKYFDYAMGRDFD